MGDDMTKRCSKCGEVKVVSEFYERPNKNKSNTIYYHSHCKTCMNVAHRPRGQKYSEKILNGKADVKLNNYNINPWKCIECGAVIPFKRKCDIITYCSGNCRTLHWIKANPEKRVLTNEKVNQKRRNITANKVKPIYNKTCNRCGKPFTTTELRQIYCGDRCRINVYRNKRYNTDTLYVLECLLRGRLTQALRKTIKSKSTLILIGCSLSELKKHLEKQFTDGMSWDNHGLFSWHIDHIRPCASFDLTDPEQQKQCFHHTNLQPLWAEDNLSKGAKYIGVEYI